MSIYNNSPRFICQLFFKDNFPDPIYDFPINPNEETQETPAREEEEEKSGEGEEEDEIVGRGRG